jgi:dihydrofolate reductase/thymidylate synthase
MFSLIVAMDSKNGIGLNGKLPWSCPQDLEYFKKITSETSGTKQNVVVMGRKTWDSIPDKYKPLSNRINIVLSTTGLGLGIGMGPGPIVLPCIDDLFSFVNKNSKVINKVFIIGGSSIYSAFLKTKQISTLYITNIKGNHDCDTFFPMNQVVGNYRKINTILKETLAFDRWEYINKDEEEYLRVMKEIMDTGNKREDRTKVGTRSLFGKTLSWDMSENIMPILTTKRTFYRGIAEELLWFINGSTDAKKLQERNVHIWDGNSSREFLDSRGLTELDAGDIGAGYGHQLRHYGAEYINCNTDYSGKGVDQLKYVVDTIKNDPHSRRILFSYWNPMQLDKMALFPCHLLYQFYIDTDTKTISCNLYQRSSDYFLANNFNIVSAVILTHMIGKLTGYTPKTLNHMIGDTHIYNNHISQCETQLLRTPTAFPKFYINDNKEYTSISDFTVEDLVLSCYFPRAGIKAPMAI